jgi:hypothetical protein
MARTLLFPSSREISVALVWFGLVVLGVRNTVWPYVAGLLKAVAVLLDHHLIGSPYDF